MEMNNNTTKTQILGRVIENIGIAMRNGIKIKSKAFKLFSLGFTFITIFSTIVALSSITLF